MLFSVARQQEILKMLKTARTVKVSELSKHFFTCEATIRRDLEKLEKKGLLKRIHGGAVLLEGLNYEIPLSVREVEHKDEKNVIGRLAADIVDDDDIIIIDSSSTALKMVEYLSSKTNLTVITNGAKTAIDAGAMLRNKIYCTGGVLRENSLSYIGDIALKCIESFYVRKLFFSCRAISINNGLTDPNEDESALRRHMIKQSDEVILLCDSTKFEKTSFVKICSFDMIDCIITEKKPSKEWVNYFSKNNVKLVYGE